MSIYSWIVRAARIISLSLVVSGVLIPVGGAAEGAAIAQYHGDRIVGVAPDETNISFALMLPYPHDAELQAFLRRLFTKYDPDFHRFLTPKEFTERFAPSVAAYNALKRAARASGLSIVQEHAGRTLLNVSGSAARVNTLFGVQMQLQEDEFGNRFAAPDRVEEIPGVFTDLGAGLVGLDQRPIHPASRNVATTSHEAGGIRIPTGVFPAGTGQNGYLSPNDIKQAYSVAGGTQYPGVQNRGQTVGLVEFWTAKYTDASQYATQYQLGPTLILCDLGSGEALPCVNSMTYATNLGAASEVILDIDMVMAIANPHAIIVYQPPTTPGQTLAQVQTLSNALAVYARIAEQDLVSEVSTSWSFSENRLTQLCNKNLLMKQYECEAELFEQMTAEGIAVFAASGDLGAFDECLLGLPVLAVGDPASQPQVTGVGGTVLSLETNPLYETAWGEPGARLNGSKCLGVGGGGGISALWGIPSYQKSFFQALPSGQASTSNRNVPDVSLNAGDSSLIPPGPFYSIYFSSDPTTNNSGIWTYGGGTSAAAPLWAGFWSLVSEGLKETNYAPITGFGGANPTLYALAADNYKVDFNDPVGGSNLQYEALPGYDLATGLGSFQGTNLFNDAIWYVTNGELPQGPTNVQAAGGNSGATLTWTASITPNVTYTIYQSTSPANEGLNSVVSGISGTTATVSSLVNGATYYFVVRAISPVTGYRSLPSQEVGANPTATISGPSAPLSPAASAGNAEVGLAWLAPASNGGAPITNYKVFRGTTSGSYQPVSTGGCSNLGVALACADTGITNGTTYYYVVEAINSVGAGPPSIQVSATPSGVTTYPTAPQNLVASPGNSQVALSWSAPANNGGAAITSYNVLRGTTSGTYQRVATGGCASLGSVLSCTDTSVSNGATYYYAINATNSAGTGPHSKEVSATPSASATFPGAPLNLIATPGNGQVTLNWTPPTNNGGSTVSSYRVFRGTQSGIGNQFIITSGGCSNLGAVTSCIDAGGLSNGTKYYYIVSAVNGVGQGAPSNQASATPSVADNIIITSGPNGSPNPVPSYGTVSLAVSATDSIGYSLFYSWASSCAGSFSNASAQNPVWTAPVNATGSQENCSITVTISDPAGTTTSKSYSQAVLSGTDTITITSGPSGTPNPVPSQGTVSMSASANESFGYPLSYTWSSSCPALPGNGVFTPSQFYPWSSTWVAPANTTGSQQSCTISITVNNNYGLSQTKSYSQGVVSINAPLSPGGAVTGEIPVNPTANLQRPWGAGMDAKGDFVVALDGTDGDGQGVYARVFNINGVPKTAEIPVNTYTPNDQLSAGAAMDAKGDFVVTWSSAGQDSTSDNRDGAYARVFHADGTAATGEIQVNTTTINYQDPDGVAMDPQGDLFVVTWGSLDQDGDYWGAYARVFRADGTPVTGEIQVNVNTAGNQIPSGVAMGPNGDFVVTWGSTPYGTTATTAYARVFHSNGVPVTDELQVNSFSSPGGQDPAGVAMDAFGNFAVTWSSLGQQTGNLSGVYARVFNANGTPATGEIQVNTYTTNISYENPAGIAMDARGDFAVIWNVQEEDGDSFGAYARLFTAGGAPATGEIPVNIYTTGVQAPTGVAMDAQGDWVVGWTSSSQGGGAYARRFAGPENVPLTLTMSQSANPVNAGAPLSYTMQITNNHAKVKLTGVPALNTAIGLASNLKVVDVLPAGSTLSGFTGTNWKCHQTRQTVTCSLGSLSPATSSNLTLQVMAPAKPGTITNTAVLTTAQYDSIQADNIVSAVTIVQ